MSRGASILLLADIWKLRMIFKARGWPIGEGVAFERLCSALACLNMRQRSLVIALTRAFLRIKFRNYQAYLVRALNRLLVERDVSDGGHNVWVGPLAKGNDLKGAGTPLYILKETEVHRHPALAHVTGMCSVIERVPKPTSQDDRLILIDDFIGSGDIADEVINEVIAQKGFTPAQIIVLVLVAQRLGKERIERLGCRVVCAEERVKGISDTYSEPEKTAHLACMGSIDAILAVPHRFRLGHKQSEALIEFIRVPDNTFPMYWHETRAGKKIGFLPPFPRYGNR